LLNQHRGYWLLFDVLFIALTIVGTMTRKYVHQVVVVLPLQCGEIDQEIEILYGKMVTKVINVLCPFLGFVETFFQNIAHNMIILMLDPCFKGMDYNGKDQVATLI
jgi:hypothetical protein